MRLPQQCLPLTALRTFEAAARRMSFKDAAEELCVSPTTVSNQIRQLERDWGCLLFVRKTRQVVLTDAGRSLAWVLSRAFDDIRTEIESHVETPRKSVTLAVGPIFGSRWLIPRPKIACSSLCMMPSNRVSTAVVKGYRALNPYFSREIEPRSHRPSLRLSFSERLL